ncbi:hypothetical protein KC660_04230 [Candidatus Dojkabacteria bacterium]|uniref:Uncharacterized protein n=1 Tax=Candidatus Dojkabacteria bacterium TaxID=2099670 RepID=A0A955L420_9BACT|nr:hypothetical protein [Candidatus Dojkabacteria bacterium]
MKEQGTFFSLSEAAPDIVDIGELITIRDGTIITPEQEPYLWDGIEPTVSYLAFNKDLGVSSGHIITGKGELIIQIFDKSFPDLEVQFHVINIDSLAPDIYTVIGVPIGATVPPIPPRSRNWRTTQD